MKKGLYILLILGLTACQNEEVPEGIMQRDKFKAALLDAQLIEARMNHELVLEQMEAMPAEKYYEEMYKEHQITGEEFERSFNYYAEHPKELQEIYGEIMEELTMMKDSVN